MTGVDLIFEEETINFYIGGFKHDWLIFNRIRQTKMQRCATPFGHNLSILTQKWCLLGHPRPPHKLLSCCF